MTNELATTEPSGLTERMKYAQALAAADLLPSAYRAKPANVLLAMEYGHALGLDTVTAIQSVHVIEGKPSASAQLIAALVRRAGHRLRVTGDDKHAVAEVIRSDDQEFTFRAEWTMERANKANLTGKAVWKQYPAAMLKARAITEVARDACPEALAGVAFTPEELEPVPTVVEEHVVDVEPIVELVSEEQIATAWKLLAIAQVPDGDVRKVVDAIVGRHVEDPADMTVAEAQVLVDRLSDIAASEDPTAELAKLA